MGREGLLTELRFVGGLRPQLPATVIRSPCADDAGLQPEEDRRCQTIPLSMSATCLRLGRCVISTYAIRRRLTQVMLPVPCVCRSRNGTQPPRPPIPALPRQP